ncbi:MAG: hypothetical protein ABJ205_06265 [Erythrobacter sp.]|uniref:hypothetical protein n=1 Tax=Erythrobacter sp. TaxID=1042 RepID=UPI003266C307
MRQSTRLLGAVSAGAFVAMSSTPALAVGTTAGDTITNSVSVSYQVGNDPNTTQTVTDSDTFTVDRVIDVNVNLTSASPVSVSPGQVQAVLAFDVTNLSNDTVDLDLSTVLTGGTSANIENITIYQDLNGDGVLQQAEIDAGAITFLDEVAADDGTGNETLAVLVVADITTDAVNGDTFDIVLVADAHEAGAAGLGVEINANNGDANTAGVDTVLADGSGTSEEAAAGGDHSDEGSFEVAGAVVSVVKSSRIVSDPVNGTTNPKAIPGAVIEYCIAVTNASGAAPATAVAVNDDLPGDVNFTVGSGIFLGTATVDSSGTIPVATCSGGTDEEGGDATFTAGGANGSGVIAGTLADIPAATTSSVYFEVTIR